MIAAGSWDGATVETLRWLLDHGADRTATSGGGVTAAWYAAGRGTRLSHHPPVGRPEQRERLAFLTETCDIGDVGKVRLLVERGVDPKVPAQSRGSRVDQCVQSPIHEAAANGSATLVAFLLELGCDPNAQDRWAKTPLMVASGADVLHVVLAGGADVHAATRSGDALTEVLDKAGDADSSWLEEATVLVAAGANPEYAASSDLDSHAWLVRPWLGRRALSDSCLRKAGRSTRSRTATPRSFLLRGEPTTTEQVRTRRTWSAEFERR